MHYLWMWSTWAEYKLLNKWWKSKTNYIYYIYDFTFGAVRIWCPGLHTDNDHVNALCTANLDFDSLDRTVVWGWQFGNDSDRGLIWDLTGTHIKWHVHLSTALATARVQRRKHCADGLHHRGGFCSFIKSELKHNRDILIKHGSTISVRHTAASEQHSI